MNKVQATILALGLLTPGLSSLGQAIADEAVDAAPFFPWLGELKILGANNLEVISLAADTPAYDFAKAIARVETSVDASGFCTGSRVAEDLFLTNFHCDIGCEAMQFTLDYEEDVVAEDRQTFKCHELIRKNETLDYALYAVEPLAAPLAPVDSLKPARPYQEAVTPVLALYRGPVVAGQTLLVAGHPSARLKEIDRSDECVLASAEITRTDSGRDTMKHMCDTEGGSSGSPVLDREHGYAIGLHWGGRMDEFNFAISMRMIVEDLEANVAPETFAKLTLVE